jgi:hypothetical protein
MVSGKSMKSLKKLQQSQFETTSPLIKPTASEEHFIDSDEEVENVMQALRSSRPAPLAQKPYFFVKRRRQCFRLRDILLDAITPKSYTEVPVDHNSMNPMYYQQQQQLQLQQQQQQQLQQQQQQQQQQILYNNNAMNNDNNNMYAVNSMNPTFSIR